MIHFHQKHIYVETEKIHWPAVNNIRLKDVVK